MVNIGRFSKKEEPLASRRWQFLFNFWNVRQLPALERRQGILQEQSAGRFLAKPVQHDVIGRLKAQRPGPRIVRVAGHEVDEPLADPPQRLQPAYDVVLDRFGEE